MVSDRETGMVGWVFRVEIVSKNAFFTSEMKAELERLLKSSPKINQFLTDELFGEEIKLFEKRKG